MAKLKKQLEQVTRTRELHRKVRRDVPYPVVALVGYTNAGKSTLFNRLTGASVLSMDKLFATLDPTMRQMPLPGGGKVILSDTVGFVSDLPTGLVAAFRATLEEVLEADILLHIRDASHEDTEAQKRDVEEVLRHLFKNEQLPPNVIEVYNKSDRLPPDTVAALRERGLPAISAVTGEGIDGLLSVIADAMGKALYTKRSYRLDVADGKSLAWLHAHGKVMEQSVEDRYIQVVVQLSEEHARRFESTRQDVVI